MNTAVVAGSRRPHDALLIDLDLQEAEKLPVAAGAWISGGQAADGSAQDAIVPGSPAEKAGVMNGDLLLSFDGIEVTGIHREGAGYRVSTTRGDLLANRVVLACNGYQIGRASCRERV